MNEIATLQPVEQGQPLTVAQLKTRLSMITQVMRDVMQKDVDFGTIPGMDKPSLYKPGAEKLCVTFRLRVPDPLVEEIAELDGGIRLRVRVPILGQDGSVLAVGVGECSSNELKYKWRAAVCEEEWSETPEDRRRKQWKKGREKPYQVKQIRTESADQVNTILKMGHKRAYVHGVIIATGASSIFTQDVEDIPEEMREPGDEAPARPATPTPQPKPAAAADGPVISEAQAKRYGAIAKGAGHDDWGKQWLRHHYQIDDATKIPKSRYDEICKAVSEGA